MKSTTLQKRQSKPGYLYLKVYQYLMIIFDLNSKFCKIYLPSPEHQRTRDQMFQAARSSKQCVVEGYTQESLKGYIYLTGIAHGSNEELREDYIDFLRQRELTKWPKDPPKLGIKSWVSRACRDIAEGNIPTYPTIPTDPEYAANVILDLSIKAGYMLKRLVESLKEKHKTEGGLTEKLYQKRKDFRGY